MREIQVVADPSALSRAAAEAFVAAARDAVSQRERFTVALSGGSTPKALYSLLAADPVFIREVPWPQTYFFFGDERHVPPDSGESNFRMADQALLSRVPIEPSQMVRIRGELADPKQAAAEYDSAICKFFQLTAGTLPHFDLVLLGLGPDGHTASLFPGTSALQERARLVVSTWVERLQTHRITLTLPVLNSARLAMFLVQGADKATVLKQVLESRDQTLPAQLVQPQAGCLRWIVDEAAASLLDRSALVANNIWAPHQERS